MPPAISLWTAPTIYFWDNGYLHGYAADGKPLFAKVPLTAAVKERKEQTIDGPEQFIRLMLGSGLKCSTSSEMIYRGEPVAP
jgi:hypothetical protein